MTPLQTILAVVALTAAPLGAMVWMVRKHRLSLKLREQGLRALAEVLRTDWSSDRDYLLVKYVFHLPDGSEVHDEYRHPPPEKPYPAVGDALEVLYLPDAPHRHQVVGTEIGLTNLVLELVALGAFVVFAVYLAVNHSNPKDPEASGSTPPGRLRTYEEPPSRSKPLPAGEKRQRDAY